MSTITLGLVPAARGCRMNDVDEALERRAPVAAGSTSGQGSNLNGFSASQDDGK